MDENMLQLIYRSFDSELSAEEQEQLDKALALSAELRAEQAKISAIRNKVLQSKEPAFRPFFADRVMARIRSANNAAGKELFFESLISVFKPLAIAAAILIIIITSYNMNRAGQVSLEAAMALPEVALEEAFDPTLSFVVR